LEAIQNSFAVQEFRFVLGCEGCLINLKLNLMKISYKQGIAHEITGKKVSMAINVLNADVDVRLFSKFAEEKTESRENIVFDWPGEYEVKGVGISMLPCPGEEENLIAYFEVDGIKVCHLGNLKGKLSENLIQEISETDVLMISIADSDLSAKEAHDVIEAIDPRIVLPMNYTQENLDEFKKEMSIQEFRHESSLDLSSRSALPESNTEYILLD
jgi:hypothetical protein